MYVYSHTQQLLAEAGTFLLLAFPLILFCSDSVASQMEECGIYSLEYHMAFSFLYWYRSNWAGTHYFVCIMVLSKKPQSRTGAPLQRKCITYEMPKMKTQKVFMPLRVIRNQTYLERQQKQGRVWMNWNWIVLVQYKAATTRQLLPFLNNPTCSCSC